MNQPSRYSRGLVCCTSCAELIPDDSIFCPECGSRQDLSRAGGFTTPNAVGLSGQEVSGGRNFGIVSGEAIRQQRDMGAADPTAISPELLQQIAQGMQNQQNIPPVGNFPPQGYTNNQQNNPNLLGGNVLPSAPLNQQPTNVMGNVQPIGQSNSPTDEMVNRIAQAEKAMKSERRNQWLNMNQTSASNVLSSLEQICQHIFAMSQVLLKKFYLVRLGVQKDAPNEAFLRRMCEVAVRRVARKRGVAVEAPQAKLDDDVLNVNITYIDDGRVLDTPEDLSQASEHAIQTEVALKGFDYIAEINLYRSKDGEIENLSEDEEDEEMFACEICDGLVKESDSKCPTCGALFEDDEDEEIESQPSRGPPRGPSRGGPPLQIALHLVALVEVHHEVLPAVHHEVPLAAHHEVPLAVHHEVPPASPSRGGPPKRSPGRAPPSGPKRTGPPQGGPKGGPPKGPRRGPPR